MIIYIDRVDFIQFKSINRYHHALGPGAAECPSSRRLGGTSSRRAECRVRGECGL